MSKVARSALVLAVLVRLLTTATAYAADPYEIDATHSMVGFAVTHMVISTVKGSFTDFAGTISYDPANLEKSSVEVRIKVASIDTRNQKRDDHLRSAEFLHAEKFPEIVFKSVKITKDSDKYVAAGDLTIRGVTKQVALPFRVTGAVKDPWGNERIGVALDPITINRMDYGVSWSETLDAGGLVVSNEVTLELAVEAIKKS
ncbi:MAG: polyisoprenoid-binding protein [Candidatus Schekmanbacteria bacterium]|nr:polyisoprenoid-binding protein [Candidatus Schekmanbacteria bacterium]